MFPKNGKQVKWDLVYMEKNIRLRFLSPRLGDLTNLQNYKMRSSFNHHNFVQMCFLIGIVCEVSGEAHGPLLIQQQVYHVSSSCISTVLWFPPKPRHSLSANRILQSTYDDQLCTNLSTQHTKQLMTYFMTYKTVL